MLKKIDVYILKGIAISFVISFLIISAVMMVGDIVKIYDVVFSAGSSLKVVVKIFGYIAIFLSIFTIPMALTISINYVISEMSNNSEITAIRSSGISLFRVYLPVFLFTIVVFVLLFYDVGFVAYKSKLSYKMELAKAFKNKIYVSLKPQTFYNQLSGGTMWMRNVSASHKILVDVFFAYKNKVFVSDKAILKDALDGVLVDFSNVKMYSKTDTGWEFGSFNKYEVLFAVSHKSNIPKEDFRYMTISELLKVYRKSHDLAAFYKINKMLSLSLSVFALSLIAFAFGITFSRSGKSAGIVVSLFLFFSFYILLMLGESLFKTYGVVFSIYIPNMIMLLFGFYIFYKKIKT